MVSPSRSAGTYSRHCRIRSATSSAVSVMVNFTSITPATKSLSQLFSASGFRSSGPVRPTSQFSAVRCASLTFGKMPKARLGAAVSA